MNIIHNGAIYLCHFEAFWMTQRNFAQKIVFKLLSKWVKCFIVQADIEMVATQYVKATICRMKTI